jgi:hypothetical protein
MYSDYKKEQGQDLLQTAGKEKHDNPEEPKILQIIAGPTTAVEQRHSRGLPKRKFVTTKKRRWYYQTRSRRI